MMKDNLRDRMQKPKPTQQQDEEMEEKLELAHRINTLQNTGIFRLELLHSLQVISENLETLNQTIKDTAIETLRRVPATEEEQEEEEEMDEEDEEEDMEELPPIKKK